MFILWADAIVLFSILTFTIISSPFSLYMTRVFGSVNKGAMVTKGCWFMAKMGFCQIVLFDSRSQLLRCSLLLSGLRFETQLRGNYYRINVLKQCC